MTRPTTTHIAPTAATSRGLFYDRISLMTFKEKVFAVVKKIPKGSVLTYKEVAKRAGSPRAFRAVGSALKTNFDTAIPCHRVVRSDGKTGGYNRGADRKQQLLKSEGALK